MAATDHPIVLDLGQVRGLVVTNGKPSDSDGSEGDVRIDPSTGIYWKRTNTTWIPICRTVLTPPSVTDLSISPSGYVGYCEASIYGGPGGIGYFAINSTNRDQAVWSKTVNIAESSDPTLSTEIMRLPEDVQPSFSTIIQGRVYTSGYIYRAEYCLYSNGISEDFNGTLRIIHLANLDWSPVTSNGQPVTQIVATGFECKSFYKVHL